MNRKEKGNLGEKIVSNILGKKGYKILERNYRNHIGEIDLISYKEGLVVFVEVKTRDNFNQGLPRQAVNYHKKMKIYRTSLVYISENNLQNTQFRYDVFEIYLKAKKYNHIKNAFIV